LAFFVFAFMLARCFALSDHDAARLRLFDVLPQKS
jgi:hypothetical protein